MTYQEAYQKATGELKAAGIPEPESDAWILLEHVTGMTRTRYYVDGFERMPKNEEDRFFELVSCRKTRIPVQHLTGVQEFMGYEFAVNEHVLVPRQDTEILVEEAEKRLLLMKKENPVKVLDMCTGSGCIPISLKLRNPQIFLLRRKLPRQQSISAHMWRGSMMWESVVCTDSFPGWIPSRRLTVWLR